MDFFAETFTFPDCWKDDVRMESLFAPFKSRMVNRENYDSKMNFWNCLIEKWCLHHKSPVVQLENLIQQFRRNNKTPVCLHEVIKQLEMNKILVSEESFNHMIEQSWTKWALRTLIGNPVKSTFNSVKNIIIQSNSHSNHLLHLPVIKKLGEEVLKSVSENPRQLMDTNELKKCSRINNTEHLDIILNFLSSKKLIAIYRNRDITLVKFAKKDVRNPEITDFDRALYSLEENKKFLEKHLEALEEKRKNLVDEARRHVSGKNKNLAKAALKRAKIVETRTEKITSGITNIESLISQMEMTKIDSHIMDSYKTGLESLKKFFAEDQLTKEKVEDVTEELNYYISLNTDIDDLLATTNFDKNCNATDQELEDELKILMEEKNHQVIGEIQFPEVPTHDLTEPELQKVTSKIAVLSI